MSRPARHLFICGCPRSGTTTLWRLLSADPRLVLGVERYGNRFFSKGFLRRENFEKDRYFDLQPGDTFYPSLEGFNPIYAKQRAAFDQAAYVGDKIPLLYNYLPQLKDHFSGAKLIMIYRNLFDVAASYKARAENPDDTTWSAKKGVDSAIHDWSRSIWAFRNHGAHHNTLPVDYEELYASDATLKAIYRYLELDIPDSVRAMFRQEANGAKGLETRRKRDLTQAEVKKLMMEPPVGGYRAIIEEAKARCQA